MLSIEVHFIKQLLVKYAAGFPRSLGLFLCTLHFCVELFVVVFLCSLIFLLLYEFLHTLYTFFSHFYLLFNPSGMTVIPFKSSSS